MNAPTKPAPVDPGAITQVIARAVAYSISSEFHPEYSARASEDVPAATLRLWMEIGRFTAQPTEAGASEITKLMRQILNAKSCTMGARALTLAMRRARQLECLTDRERLLIERYEKSSNGE
jgi:hypothetical protein